jgi:hypothetical protein
VFTVFVQAMYGFGDIIEGVLALLQDIVSDTSCGNIIANGITYLTRANEGGYLVFLCQVDRFAVWGVGKIKIHQSYKNIIITINKVLRTLHIVGA